MDRNKLILSLSRINFKFNIRVMSNFAVAWMLNSSKELSTYLHAFLAGLSDVSKQTDPYI